MEDIAEEGRKKENYDNLCKRLSEFHCTMLGMDGASGEAGDRRLSAKQKSKSFDVPPAVADAEPALDGEEPQHLQQHLHELLQRKVLLLLLRHHKRHRRAGAGWARRWRPGLSLAALCVGGYE